MSNLFGAPVEIKMNNVVVGRTLGDVTLERVRASYADLRRQDSIHCFGFVKQEVLYEIVLPLAEHTAQNIAREFDVELITEGEGEEQTQTINFADTAVHEHSISLKARDNKTISFTKVVQVGTGGITYSWNQVTVLPLRLWVILGSVGTPASLDDNDLPGQFNYRIESRPRRAVYEVYGGLRRFNAPFVDTYIHWDCELMTLAQKNTLEDTFRLKQGQEIAFNGLHGESFNVWFDEMDAPSERFGKFNTAGTLIVVEEIEDES